MNRILILLIRLLFRERTESKDDSDRKYDLLRKIMKECEEEKK